MEKQKFRLVYMYGKEIREEMREGNEKGKGNNKSGKWREKGNKSGKRREKGKLSDCSPCNNIYILFIIFYLWYNDEASYL